MKPKLYQSTAGLWFFSSFENMTQPSTVHLPTSSVLSGLKKNRTESERVNVFHASQIYVGGGKDRMLKNKIKQVSAQIPHSDCLYITHVTDKVAAL